MFDWFWKSLARLADLWSLTEPVRNLLWIPIVSSGSVTAVINWLGIPLWQAVIIGLCVLIGVVLAVAFTIHLTRQFSSLDKLGDSPRAFSEPAAQTRYGRIIQVTFFIILFIGFVYLHSLLQGIRRDMDCYVTPRRLTTEQIEAIANYLKQYDPYDITIIFRSPDEEVDRYFSDLRAAFTQGNWRVIPDVVGVPQPGLPVSQPGLHLNSRSNEQVQKDNNKRRPNDPPNPGERVSEALRAVGVLSGGGGGLDPNLKDEDYYKVSLTIGPRSYPRDCEYKEGKLN